MTRDVAREIRMRREESNTAIAARDLEGVIGCMMPDVVVSVAGGPVLTGRAASREAFAQQFADVTFRGYTRDADHIAASDNGTHATERGRWYGRWRHRAGEHVMRGTYVAVWCHTELGWFIESEAFVSAG